WLAAAAATTLPLAGWAVALPLAITGDPVAIGVILAANALDYTRARLRQRIPRKLWGIEMPTRVARLDRWGTPAWLALHAVVVWSTLSGRSVAWAGRVYRLDAQAQLESVARAS